MKQEESCITCVLNQMSRVIDYAGIDPGLSRRIGTAARERAGEIAGGKLTAPEFAGEIYRVFTALSGISDPYKSLRKEQNDLVLNHLEFFKNHLSQAPDPLYAAALYALLGNIIDYGGVEIFDTGEVFGPPGQIRPTLDDYPEFRQKLAHAESLLIIGDNAGEAVLDRLFIEEVKRFNPSLHVIYGVRSGPAINDVLLEDAHYIGLPEVAEVIPTGATYAGTRVSRSTTQFRHIYHHADLVISKGQGNYETLEQEEREILFIFKVKCPVVSRYSGIPLGSLVLAFNRSLIPYKLGNST